MNYPLRKDRYTLSAVDFWWERCLRRIVKTRSLMSRRAQARIVQLIQVEKPALRKVLA